mmetsp:Transcript_11339/g.28748  ORF Transcript_11339/g.28748 Transcript_11339/m.28748 type:complete len:213 (+) Transcript_11339:2496-3134(+)
MKGLMRQGVDQMVELHLIFDCFLQRPGAHIDVSRSRPLILPALGALDGGGDLADGVAVRARARGIHGDVDHELLAHARPALLRSAVPWAVIAADFARPVKVLVRYCLATGGDFVLDALLHLARSKVAPGPLDVEAARRVQVQSVVGGALHNEAPLQVAGNDFECALEHFPLLLYDAPAHLVLVVDRQRRRRLPAARLRQEQEQEDGERKRNA